jgi:hypothetical protein
MSHDVMSCGWVEKIKRQGLAMKDQVASVKEKSRLGCDGLSRW